jgi:signal transduction histidine kinase
VELPQSAHARRNRLIQDAVWICLIVALAVFGPDRSATTMESLFGLALLQLIEPRIAFFSTYKGSVISLLVKLALCYVLIGWTDGIASSYYWILLVPVISAGTSLGLLGTAIATAVACGLYLSFLLFLPEGFYVPIEEAPQLILRLIILPVIGFLTHQLAEASREEARRYKTVAEQLSDANRQLREAEAAVRRSERLAALGQLSAGLAHELRNPMGTMKASAEMLARNVEGSNDVAREMAGFISSEVDRTNSLITRFLDFARPMALRLGKTNVSEVIDRAIAELKRHQPPFDVVVQNSYSPDVHATLLDAELMERAIYNLLLNAAQASPPKGTITVQTRDADGRLEIAVIDSGSGIERQHLENIFNPFFTTKSNGVGLGLAIISKIVDEHGGKITVDSEAGSGSTFRLYLPFREQEAR